MCFLALLGTSCSVEIPVTGNPNPNYPIYDLRKLYTDAPVGLSTTNMKDAVSITGVVISDVDNGNAPENKIILQGYKGKNVNGIVLDVGEEASKYKFGDSLVVWVDGATLNKVNGMLQISNIGQITKISSGKKPLLSTTFTSIASLREEAAKYESTLVGLTSMFVVDPELGKRYVDDLKLTDWAEDIDVPVAGSSVFANEEVNNLANYTFLLQLNAQSDPVVLLQNLQGVNELAMEEHRPGQLYEGFPEDFTDKVGSSNSLNHNLILPTTQLPWIFQGAYTLFSGNFIFTNGYVNSTNKGDQLGMMMTGNEGSYIELNKNLYYGASKLDLNLYPATSSDYSTGKLPLHVRIDYSKNSGATWTQVGNIIEITENRKYPASPLLLDIDGIVRFRITLVKKGENNSGGRLGIDFIRIYQK